MLHKFHGLPFPVVRNRYFFLADVFSVTFAAAVSFYLRLDAEGIRHYHQTLAIVTIAAVLVKPIVLYYFGLYRRYWRYASVDELLTICVAVSIASIATTVGALMMVAAANVPSIPRSIPIMDWLLTLALVGGARFTVRVLGRGTGTHQGRRSEVRHVLVMGAGDAGAMIVREMRHNPGLGLMPVGFVDDNTAKMGLRIHDVPVLGTRQDIPALAKRLHVEELIIAMPTAPGLVIRDIKHICNEIKLPFRTMPGVYELLDAPISVKQLRPVRIEDLLRREPVVTDQAGVNACVRGAHVLVTGAGGSIGSELCRQLAWHEPSLLVLLGRGEFSIFNIERELRRRFPRLPVESVIADVRDTERMERIVRRYRPAMIFHAAAHKHVPLMEGNPEEAFTNNVLGTQSVLRVAERTGVERFVMISTDKAVNPTSVMGATKRVAEMLVHDTAVRIRKPYVAVRFGNVLGSRGSAIPVFQEQIASGGPVTVTHPEMRRYFMTIPEAVQLVLQAAVLGKGGEVFMLDMGEPVKVMDLVHDLIELSGLTPGEDIEIVYTGVRPGEKLYEEMWLNSEAYAATSHDKIFVSRNGTAPVDEGCCLERQVAHMAELARGMETGEMILQLCQLVPEFKPSHIVPDLPDPYQATEAWPVRGDWEMAARSDVLIPELVTST